MLASGGVKSVGGLFLIQGIFKKLSSELSSPGAPIFDIDSEVLSWQGSLS